MPDELSRRISAMLFECLQIAKTTVFINESILVEAAVYCSLANQAGRRHELHIDLAALTGVEHLFVRLWAILGVGKLNCGLFCTFEHLQQAGDRPRIATLPELNPEYNQPGVGIPTPHILYLLQLRFCVLSRMMLWTA